MYMRFKTLDENMQIASYMYISLDKNYKIHHIFFFAAYMVLQILLPKSSAKYLATRRFSQKGFVDLDFGHR